MARPDSHAPAQPPKLTDAELERLRLERAIEGTGAGTWEWNLQTNEVHYNRRWAEMLGYELDELLPHNLSTWINLTHPEDYRRAMEMIERHLKGEIPMLDVEIRMRHRNGSWVWILDRGRVLTYTPDGKPECMFGTHLDITAQKQLELETAEKNRILLFILEEVLAGFWELNFSKGTAYYSPRFKQTLGCGTEEFPDTMDAWKKFVSPGEVAKVAAEFEEYLRCNRAEPYRNKVTYIHRSGNPVHILCVGRVLERTPDGAPARMLGCHVDITPLRQTEEALRQSNRLLEEALAKSEELAAKADAANRAKSQFLANMSHEIRTPMNGVIGMACLLADSHLTEEQKELLGILQSSAQSLMELLNDILDLSKIEAGHMRLESKPFDLHLLLREIETSTRLRASSQNLEFQCTVSGEVPQWVEGDSGRLRQVLDNLLGNALKFTERGRIGLGVSVAGGDCASKLVRFEVRDTGPGIPPEKQGLLFERFSQLDNSLTRRHGGTGLGLAICKQLVEMQGGQIGVDSKPGEGSTFWFTANLAISEAGGMPQ